MRINGRINVSHSPSELLDLAAKVYVKHQADGESSPLNSLVDNNWVVTGPKIAQALEIHQEAEGLRKKMEELYRERDIMLPEIEEIVRNSRNMLKSLHTKNPKRLGDWGFVVDDSVQKAPVKVQKPA